MLIDAQRVRGNIQRMARKAERLGARFRPHFKTHQSAKVGEWLREAGVSAITVSSLEMAVYFARHGWRDISVAFPLNLRELPVVSSLSERIRLGVLVESGEIVLALAQAVEQPVDVWIEIDSGSGRTGIPWQEAERALMLCRQVLEQPRLRLRGLLTHAGATYASSSTDQIVQTFAESNQRMAALRSLLGQGGVVGLEISVGDTPGCALSPQFDQLDEIRPGNFVFYDAQMLQLGVCREEDVAAAVACPLVTLHPQRGEAVVYGGAIHLSKDTVQVDGKNIFGWVVDVHDAGWSLRSPDAYAARLSQEHGVLSLPLNRIAAMRPGQLVGIIPAHVCLTVSALGCYRTLEGDWIETLVKAPG
ncbi:MAG: alanine racemase [Chloroflexota bacterium]|jgi:D-serine deaminase-like pyridoxal phosphate-dependent protein